MKYFVGKIWESLTECIPNVVETKGEKGWTVRAELQISSGLWMATGIAQELLLTPLMAMADITNQSVFDAEFRVDFIILFSTATSKGMEEVHGRKLICHS